MRLLVVFLINNYDLTSVQYEHAPSVWSWNIPQLW